jgi:hypothetical protein
MGREIRRVPLDWEHPKEDGKYLALYDKTYEDAKAEWLAGLASWQNGTHPDLIDNPEFQKKYEYWEWSTGPPNRESYRPEFTSDPVGYQIYETVSEGTPASPVFATEEEIIEYLVAQGYTPTAATQFVKDKWAISMVYTPQTGLIDGIEACDIKIE